MERKWKVDVTSWNSAGSRGFLLPAPVLCPWGGSFHLESLAGSFQVISPGFIIELWGFTADDLAQNTSPRAVGWLGSLGWGVTGAQGQWRSKHSTLRSVGTQRHIPSSGSNPLIHLTVRGCLLQGGISAPQLEHRKWFLLEYSQTKEAEETGGLFESTIASRHSECSPRPTGAHRLSQRRGRPV